MYIGGHQNEIIWKTYEVLSITNHHRVILQVNTKAFKREQLVCSLGLGFRIVLIHSQWVLFFITHLVFQFSYLLYMALSL